MRYPRLKLISHYLCPYVQRARIVLAEKTIPHELEFINLAAKPDWFRAISPLGKVPVLLVDGEPLFESAAIVEYLDEITPGSLHPADAYERARHRAWIEYASGTLNTIADFYNAPDAASLESQAAKLTRRFGTLDRELGQGAYFGGQDFSLVDAAFGPVFRYFDVIDNFADFGVFATSPRVQRWRNALHQRPSVRDAVVNDYPRRLTVYLRSRESALSRLISRRAA
jgi:glutathione S-transferase